MARRSLPVAPKCAVIQFPDGGRKAKTIDVRALLLDNQSNPTVPVPTDLQNAIDRRAEELSREAYQLCREHLQRRVAWEAEIGSPRQLHMRRAYEVIAEGDLGDALVRVYREKLEDVARYANNAKRVSEQFADEIRAVMQPPEIE